MTPADKLTAMRQALGFTVPQTAALIGNCTERAIRHYTRGTRRIPPALLADMEAAVAYLSALHTARASGLPLPPPGEHPAHRFLHARIAALL